ncbi:DEAD/DEAH box helicase [Litchfieldia salsa]|uniref:Superfamily I DNA and/or RNA helicase n=1 Tax=Litchfieldia salsa TaxID=930152 RepID=A0A1H0VZI1_9BACI|nr:AAA domain-containing protein [Litchfieldia salsa]SDP83897.1 Superfamily I DNA and/or RNA helicase [Litchfieldia salsa]
MKTQSVVYRCPLALTNKAKDKIRELGTNEGSFFSLETSFNVYIEKYPETTDRPLSVAIFLDKQASGRVSVENNGLIIVLHCVVEKDRFITTNVTTRSGHLSVETNWRRPVHLKFDLTVHRGGAVPLDLLNLIHEMPVAQESSEYVKKRIASWEGYLKIQERSADIPDMISPYSGLTFNRDFSRMTISGCKLNDKEWKSLKDLSVKLKGIDQDVGKVLKANRTSLSIEIELNGYMEDRARQQRFNLKEKEVTFSNFATLSQVKRLRQGFRLLENGLAANPELERLLFENKPPVSIPKKRATLKFHNRLNEFQQEAVIGAMSAEDLYVIQGPPGTGKTTVISEICLQNARAGLRTLVASQSNLAVDNALGRLLANKDIRILRVGRTESIEEEGKKFIEENVGQYWKDHTLEEVSSQYEAGRTRIIEIESEWDEVEQKQKELEPLLLKTQSEVKAKQEAEKKFSEIQSILDEQKQKLEVANHEKQVAAIQVRESQETLHSLNAAIEDDELFLIRHDDSETIQKRWDDNEQAIKALRQSITCGELEIKMDEVKQASEQASSECEKWAEAINQLNVLFEKIAGVKRVDGLKWIILEQNIKRTFKVRELVEQLEEIRGSIDQLEKLKQYNDKLTKAITYVESLLNQYNVQFQQFEQRQHYAYSAVEIDQFLAELRNKLTVQRSNINPGLLMSSLEGLYNRRGFLAQKRERLLSFDNYKRKAQEAFGQLKSEIVEQLQQKQNENKQFQQKWAKTLQVQSSELDSLQSKYREMTESAEVIPNAKEMLQEKEATGIELKEKIETYEGIKQKVEDNLQKREEEVQLLASKSKELEQVEARLTQLEHLSLETEKELLPLKEILSSQPEKEHEKVLTSLASLSFKRESLKQEKLKLPLFQSVQGKWLSLLEEANEHDLDEIRKIYVKHANVIGTTCVASARKDFIDNYPEFDVVIIDEVSKATPPELLLPMLKGKKIILVGDHHQLPPLLGNDTLEETLQEMADESDDFEGKVELKRLLKESLFERLYKNLPNSNKTMLAIQYRMHEKIMETIAPFYEHESDRLQCGLNHSDLERDHLLESPLIKRDNHLLWIDIPNEPTFFEERMKGGKSLYNPAELKEISRLLLELDESTEQAKLAGRLEANQKKSIGVISFYGEQVKRVDRLIQQELNLRNLTIRTGTVDRFQGMEMDIILLSMVRNHDHKQDDIGFAKDYRRLNVALSRAKELLVLIGSTKMFTERTKQEDTKRMYTHVLNTTKKQQGLRMLQEVR